MKNLFKLLVIVFGLSQLVSCNHKNDVDPISNLKSTVAIKWADVLLSVLHNQPPYNGFPSNSPTFVSRGTGYVGLTMYESIVAGSNKYKSIASQLNGLGTLPSPEAGKTVDWETSLNAGQSQIIKKIWWVSPNASIMKIDSLEKAIEAERLAIVKDTAIINYSKTYGRLIASKIFEWSNTDGGKDGNLAVFPFSMFPRTDSTWVPPTNGQANVAVPMHPKWGKNRTFLAVNSNLAIPTKLNYSIDPKSAYYQQFYEVYQISKTLTQEQKEIAAWWADDPSVTAAPPGHSYNLAKILIKQQEIDLIEAASTFAKVGMSTADAFVNCWKVKYTYFSERPTGYIRRTMNPSFIQIWPEPPFPAFTSGHATQASAASEALISVFGDNVSFVDNTYVGREKDYVRNIDYKARTFTKISDSAVECAMSRLYGGIHSRPDNDKGMEMGKIIGQNIAKLSWKK